MTYTFKLSRRMARLRAAGLAAIALVVLGCDGADSFEPEGGSPGDGAPAAAPDLASASYAGGMPIGLFGMPIEEFGSRYNAATKIIFPKYLLRDLAAIKSRGGEVILNLAGGERGYKDAAGNFSLSLWKAKLDQFQGVDFSSYIDDGTIIGHFLIDEPQDPTNWNGKPISQATLEEMARYSKARWPKMVTIARTWPDYLDNWSRSYQYLDAAWAQYAANRWKDPYAFLNTNVKKAKGKGLALVVGMNVIKGSPTKGAMSASQVRNYGSALLSSTYPCAFISWNYRDWYVSTSAMKDAMLYIRKKAQNRSFKSCRGA